MKHKLLYAAAALALLGASGANAVEPAAPTPSLRTKVADFAPPPPPKSPTSATLAHIRAAGTLACAVVSPREDWNGLDIHGDISGLEAEICRGMAAAVLGDPSKATINVYPGEPEATFALRGGDVQVAIGLSPSTALAVAEGLTYGRPVFYDSVRLLTHKESGIHTAADLQDRLICAMDLSFAETTIQDALRARGIRIGLQSHSEQGENDAAVAVRRCAAGAGTETRLAQSRGRFKGFTPNFVFLPERWGLSPMVLATRNDDPLWSRAADVMVDALLQAEASGLGQNTITTAATREDIGARELTGRDVSIPRAFGLPKDWAEREISAVGNYGEIFERTIGQSYHLERGLNALWSEGGLMAPEPLH